MQCTIPRTHSRMLSKKISAGWQEASHGWAMQNNQWDNTCVAGLTELKQVTDWEKCPVEFKPYYETPEHLDTDCCEWTTGNSNAEVQMLTDTNSKSYEIRTYTDCSVTWDWSDWGFAIKLGLRTTQEEWCQQSRPPA